MIRVWTDAADAGVLDRFGARGSTFVYQPGAPPARAVSVTMPMRLPSGLATGPSPQTKLLPSQRAGLLHTDCLANSAALLRRALLTDQSAARDHLWIGVLS